MVKANDKGRAHTCAQLQAPAAPTRKANAIVVIYARAHNRLLTSCVMRPLHKLRVIMAPQRTRHRRITGYVEQTTIAWLAWDPAQGTQRAFVKTISLRFF